MVLLLTKLFFQNVPFCPKIVGKYNDWGISESGTKKPVDSSNNGVLRFEMNLINIKDPAALNK